MPGGPCADNPTSSACMELLERLAAQAPEKIEALAAQIPDTSSITEILKTNAPAVMERLNAAIAHIGTWVETGEAFTTEQVPLLVKEIVWWGFADQAFFVVLGALFLAASAFAARLAVKKWAAWGKLDANPEDFCKSMSVGVSIAGFVLGFPLFIFNIMDMLKPLVAPRLYLIEYFRHLVK